MGLFPLRLRYRSPSTDPQKVRSIAKYCTAINCDDDVSLPLCTYVSLCTTSGDSLTDLGQPHIRNLSKSPPSHHDHSIPHRRPRNLQPILPALEARTPIPVAHTTERALRWYEDRVQDAATDQQRTCEAGCKVQCVKPRNTLGGEDGEFFR